MTGKKKYSPGTPIISLRLKVAAVLLIVLAAGLAASVKLAIDFQSRQLIKQTERESRTMAGLVHDSINSAMLRGRTGDVRDILVSLGRNERVKGVWLTNHDGIIVASSKSADLGRNISEFEKLSLRYKNEACTLEGGMSGCPEPVFVQSIRFDNRAECRPCHMGEGPVLGWLTVETSIDEPMKDLADMKTKLVAGATGLGLIMAIAAAFAITRMVNRPVEKLADAMKQAETDMEVRLEPSRNDETRLLYEGFNSLMARLKQARADADRLHSDELAEYAGRIEISNMELDDKVKKLSALSVLGRNMIEIHKLDDLLKMVLNTSMRELSGESGSVMLYEAGVGELIIHHGVGLAPEGHRKSRFRLGEGIAGWVAKHKKTVMADSALDDNRYVPGRGMMHRVPILSVPFLGSKGNILGVINIERSDSQMPFTSTDMEYLTAIAGQASVAIENVELIQNLQKSYYDTISALAMTVEAKDPYTLGHSKRVTQYAMAIADEMGLPDEDMLTIQYGSTLHDIGKIGVRESVLNKPGTLTEDEFIEIMEHSVIGENIVKGVDFLQKTRPIIRNHQERYDGTGYPDRLKGDEIPIVVAIVTVADNFDALTTDRPYRKAFTAAEAMEKIKNEAGKKLNPAAVEAFIRIFES